MVFNALGFWLRNCVPHAWDPVWPRPVTTVSSDVADARPRLEQLAATFDLRGWPGLLEDQDLRESLYVLDLLDRQVLPHLSSGNTPLYALDVGSKNGCYLPGLVAATSSRAGAWDAVELDAHRRYRDFSTRRTHARRLLRGLGGEHRFVCGSVEDSALGLRQHYHVITWLLPFVRPQPLSAWGLPESTFAPERLFRSVHARLAPDGVMLVVNQDMEELDAQQRLLHRMGVEHTVLGQVDSVLSPFRQPRFGVRVHAPPA